MGYKIHLSFKQTTKDMKLYTRIKQEEEQSVFIKKALEFYINHIDKDEKQAKKA